jgi:hypothetical protein
MESRPVNVVEGLSSAGADEELLGLAVDTLLDAGGSAGGRPMWALTGLARVWPEGVARALLLRVSQPVEEDVFWRRGACLLKVFMDVRFFCATGPLSRDGFSANIQNKYQRSHRTGR